MTGSSAFAWSGPLAAIAAMCAIVAVRYLVTSGGFAWFGNRLIPGLHHGLSRQIGAEIRWSLLSAIVYGVPAGLAAWAWQAKGLTRIYNDIEAYPLWWLPLSLVLALVLQDAWFYWTHRLMHRRALFRIMHAVHHASRPPTAWAAMSFHPSEALTMAFFVPALVFLVPLHVGVVGLLLLVMTIMGVTNHMGWEMFPRRLVEGRAGDWIITASHHQRHHQRYDGNYGLYFRYWDRLCGTDRGLGTFERTRR
ncbi:C-5 sterol desaturase [Novosphingobium kunmingense]|uniref:C-5 sterol desaturase n=1 Tax=Novosphingobium kunmingense TaxID=1211806 RepID=A0A2N0H6J2_9SPHN|nr:sterol desaturase family protein [Novosphingobium kunmingense]PKB14542.1 C-5 sterol desaturase [Novosphingobium kunmingense]